MKRAQGPLRLVLRLIGGSLLGKILGFAREIALARLLGAGMIADSFRGALTGALLPVAPLQGDVVPAVLIPLHQHWRAEGRAPRMFAALSALFLLLSLALTAAVEAGAGAWVDMVVGGFGPDARMLAVRFLRAMALIMPASVLLNCLSALELSLHRSRITSVRASVLNIGVLIGIAIAGITGQPLAIAWSFTAAFNVVTAWGAWTLWREGELAPGELTFAAMREAWRAFWPRMRPMLVQPLGEQGNTWLERALGSRCVTGTVASLDYARTLSDSAFSLISQPLGYVVLARGAAATEAGRRAVADFARPILAVMLPASAAVAVFAPDIVQVVFARGQFGRNSVWLTSGALTGMAVGMWATTLGWVLIRMLNAAGRNGRAATILLGAFAANAAFNLLGQRLLGAAMQHAVGLGSLWLGLGEALRGIVLLGGAAIALRSGRTMAGLMLCALPGCGIVAGGGLLIRGLVPGAIARLALGAPLALLVAFAMQAWLSPDMVRMAWRRIRGLRSPVPAAAEAAD